MRFATLLAEGLIIGFIAAGFCLLYCLLADRSNRRRAAWIAAQEREEDEPRPSALVACQRCGRETKVINGLYTVVCDCELEEMGS